MATIASVSVAVTGDGDDDQGLLENGPLLLDHGGELGFRKLPPEEWRYATDVSAAARLRD